jgi:hypothetical protein
MRVVPGGDTGLSPFEVLGVMALGRLLGKPEALVGARALSLSGAVVGDGCARIVDGSHPCALVKVAVAERLVTGTVAVAVDTVEAGTTDSVSLALVEFADVVV